MASYRLDKFLADAGIGTRTEIKKYIKRGLVEVNQEIATKPEHKVNPEQDQITFQGEVIALSQYEYYILNKPAGYVSATRDNTAPTVISLLPSRRKDLFPVGRLDKDTEGLLLITNDGELAHRLLSPKYHVDKTYYAVIQGIVTDEDVAAFARGLDIGDQDLPKALPAHLEIQKVVDDHSYIQVTIQEGKFHQVKRMFHAVGKEVEYLQRIHFGNLTLPKELESGESRPLTAAELESLQRLVYPASHQ